MNFAQVKRVCRELSGASEYDSGVPYNWLVYSVGGRKFAYFKTSEPERWRFSVRVTPGRFVELTDMPGVKPARYRGRYGWITIVDVASFLRRTISARLCKRRTTGRALDAPVRRLLADELDHVDEHRVVAARIGRAELQGVRAGRQRDGPRGRDGLVVHPVGGARPERDPVHFGRDR